VDERHQDEIDGTTSAARKGEWVRPEVDRLLAGGAENASGTDVDAADLSS
jgi:hypothetical protein